MGAVKKGDKVKWKWGANTAKGKVVQTFDKPVTKTIKGKEIVRKGSKDNKALLIQNEKGEKVLHLESKVKKGK